MDETLTEFLFLKTPEWRENCMMELVTDSIYLKDVHILSEPDE